MGGNLFHLPRMPRREYLEVEAAMRRYLDGRIDYRIPRYYGDKADFGDLDILVGADLDREAIVRDLGITRHRSVGQVFSTVFRGLQTDFFRVDDLETAWTFMSFNDLGNFIGRICHRFNLKYGEQGLSYVYRDGNYVRDLELTRDFARTCAFLGLDHAKWVAGFATLPEMFDWMIASRWFSVAPYLDESTSELRSRGRTTVTRFIEYLRSRGVDRRVAYEEREAYLPMIRAEFPNLAPQLERERAAEARRHAVAAKFSGQLVMRLRPELQGRELGEFIMAFKASIPDFEAWVLSTPAEEIERRIRGSA